MVNITKPLRITYQAIDGTTLLYSNFSWCTILAYK